MVPMSSGYYLLVETLVYFKPCMENSLVITSNKAHRKSLTVLVVTVLSRKNIARIINQSKID